MIKYLFKNLWCALTILEPCSVCYDLKKLKISDLDSDRIVNKSTDKDKLQAV
jgi:hypothetical protein